MYDLGINDLPSLLLWLADFPLDMFVISKKLLPALSIAFLAACSNVQPYNDNGEVVGYDERYGVVITRGALLFQPYGSVPAFGKPFDDEERPPPAQAGIVAAGEAPVPAAAAAPVVPVVPVVPAAPVVPVVPAAPMVEETASPAVVLFGHASARLSPQAVAAILRELPKIRQSRQVRVRGLADRSGSRDYNLGLSAARAREVASLLEKHGIARDRMVTEGLGDHLASARCPDGAPKKALIRCFASDRRVEISALD